MSNAVNVANNAHIDISLGGSEIEEGSGAGICSGGQSLPKIQLNDVAIEVDELLPIGPVRPLEPKPVFCELCELTTADDPDCVLPADTVATWKEIARLAKPLCVLFFVSGYEYL